MSAALASSACSVIVTSCDAYRDVEAPFLALFRRFWPDCPYELVLVSETGAAPGFDRTLLTGPAPDWRTRTVAALEAVSTPYVLFLCNDYFLSERVDTAALAALLAFARERRALNLRMNPLPPGRTPLAVPPGLPALLEFPRHTAYAVSCQAGFWDREFMLSLARQFPSAWEFERRGSYAIGEEFAGRPLLVTAERQFPFVDAVHKGHWERAGLELCRRCGIEVDWRRRGLPPWSARLKEALKRWAFELNPELVVRLQNRLGGGA